MTEGNAIRTDYVLGTRDDEIARLGTQHQVWRAHMLDAWTRAGLTRGSSLVDFGAGPGYATCDAAEIVGREGRVTAVERSPAFLEFARRQIERRDMPWVSFVAADLVSDDLALSGFDLAWCRWVASFVSSPATLLEKVAASLRVGGRAVFHEYQDYSTWRVIPASRRLDSFVKEVMSSWRSSGGEPNIAASLLPQMAGVGLRLIEVRPLIFSIRPAHFAWRWPASFVHGNSRRLVELGRIPREDADALRDDFHALEQNPDAVMITPLVLEIIAEKTSTNS
jgi:ubiquinone/menaquinone biosynthesis C-methylase UbiE